MAALIGRRKERAELDRLTRSPRPEFLAVIGRRRVGKTYLLRGHFANSFCFALTGIANGTLADEIGVFNDAVAEYGGGKRPRVAGWRDAFLVLRQIIEDDPRPGKKVVLLDELPWLATRRSGFLEALGHFWNSWAMMRDDLLLIVCGSATSWMSDKIINNKGGLHNRVTGSLHIKPFSLGECEHFLTANGVVMTRHQIVEAYMIFGGIPYYLGLLKPYLSLAQCVDELCFAEAAPLRDEFHNLYASLFPHAEPHIAVATALSHRTRGLTRADIIAETKLTNGGGLTQTLRDLTRSGFIRRYAAFGKEERDALFQLADFFSLFALRFRVGQKEHDARFWSNYAPTPAHAAWSGYAFEQVALSHIEQIRRALGITGTLLSYASWIGSLDGERAQIDLVIDRHDQVINLCEMKYSIDPLIVDAALERAIRRQRAVFASTTKTRKALHSTLVTTFPIEPTPHASVFQSVITLDDLFEPA